MAYTAVVTGSTGYIATELVSQLLQKGYNVRGTVRSKKNPAKYSALTKLADSFPGTLEMFEADLTTPGSYDAVVKGADYIFHLASPVTFTADDPQKEIVDPAVQGSLSLLQSVAKSKDTVKRVVLTSSVVAVTAVNSPDQAPPKNGKTLTEADWNEASKLPEQAYHISKTKAEQAAWEFAKQNDIDLVTLLPSQVLGPAISPNGETFSVAWFTSLLETGTVPAQFGQQIDVRDLAKAHILAAEVPSASGRYLITLTEAPPLTTAVNWLRERFPEYEIPTGAVDQPAAYPVNNSKAAKELGLVLTDVKTSFIDMAVTLIQLGIAHPKRKA